MELYGDFLTSVKRALSEIDKNWESYDGLIIAGSHTPKEVDSLIAKIKQAREKGTPFLGICYGHQLAAIQYARDIMGIPDATSQEFGEGTWVVKKRGQMKVGQYDGESFWSNYEIAIKWQKPTNFLTVPYHPEYQSRVDKPHPILVEFIKLCQKQVSL